MKIDPYKHKEKYLSWKNSLDEIDFRVSENNSKIFLKYMSDMEQGLNVASGSKKGARSYVRLNNLKQRMLFLIKSFEEKYGLKDITKVGERELHDFFTGMRNGTVRRQDGKQYKSPADYVKVFKAFWHWHQKVNRKKGITIYDITMDLDISNDKPKWVYLDENQVKKMCDNAKSDPRFVIIIKAVGYVNLYYAFLAKDSNELSEINGKIDSMIGKATLETFKIEVEDMIS